MTYRRNFLIRAVGTVAGDLAVGVAVASACAWIIQCAALGTFLSFVLWLLAIAASLALSQYVVHPVSKAVLSDRKLDQSIAAINSLARELVWFAEGFASPPWEFVRSGFSRYATGFARK